ncbi:unnamed protein product [Ceutorhynchus assimilis]|uniref:Uncharacterized protein n=1 Tax=Ceutorhynchus assimilis TaxID=467358 RepID=A0A9N9MZW7_9CUCU|nr:unnamed protein product [Ceutorhynchus assimilis]
MFCVFLTIFAVHACFSAPCPQFLPVTVQLDPYMPMSRASVSLKTLVKVKDDQDKLESNLVLSSSDYLKDATTKRQELFEVPAFPVKTSTKKRRRARPNGHKNLILNPNTGWALKTINDQPAMEVLMTDKASVARDLKDSTESALIAVKKLKN